jgi:general secretion pathway protein L
MRKVTVVSELILRSGLGPLLGYWHASIFPAFLRWWGGQLVGCLPEKWQQRITSDNEVLVYWRGAGLWDHNRTTVEPEEVRHSNRLAKRVLVLASEDVLTRQILLPPTAAAELSAIMMYEVDRYMPFTAEQVYLDFERPLIRPDKSLQVNFVVVARHRLDVILQTLSDQGMRVAAVDALDSDGHRLRVDLTPADWRADKADPSRRVGRILTALSVSLILLAMHLWVVDRENKLDVMRSEIRELRSRAQEVQNLRQSLSAAQNESQYVEGRKALAPSMIGLLSELSQCIPSNAWLEQLLVNPAGDVSFDGQSDQASGLIAQMKNCNSLISPGFSGVIQTDTSTGKDRFSVLAHLKREGQQHVP